LICLSQISSIQAKTIGQKERLRTIRDLDEAAIKLRKACEVLLDETCKDEKIRETAFLKVSREQLSEAVSKVDKLARPRDENYHQEVIELYGRTRRFLPTLLRTIDFKGSPSGQPFLKALHFLKQIEDQRKVDMSKAPLEGISKTWLRRMVDSDNKINRHAYTLCVLERLQDNLRRRDVFCNPSERWGDPRVKLLKGKEWESVREQVCTVLGLKKDAEEEILELERNLNEAYEQTIKNLPNNSDVRIEQKNGRDMLILTGLDKIEESPGLNELRDSVGERLPRVDLPEVLLEIHERTGFAEEFTHISESRARASDLHISICAVLLSEACNIGLEPLIREDISFLTRDRLSWIQQNYIRADTITKANARLVDAQAQILLAQQWGGGEVASADGLRFVTPICTINAGHNRKYFGVGRGITYYNFTSDQFTGFHGIVIPGTLRDSLFILEGLLEQQTNLRPTEIMADTAGVSDIVFGLFWLLGYQFSPRLADIGRARFWRPSQDADYGVLNEIARHRVNRGRIIRNWDDMLRVAGSLKLGTIRASELMKSLLRSKNPSTLARAIGDVGRISKTIYLLNYYDSELYRRRILTQLNRGEGRHMVAREICHGRRGEIRKRYREGQEDQLGALGLVLNVVVLWQTLYMDAALTQLRSEGVEINPEDAVRLSPLRHNNINFLGRYSFSLTESVKRGELRPLRNPNNIDKRS
jgi:TnpA family transposase